MFFVILMSACSNNKKTKNKSLGIDSCSVLYDQIVNDFKNREYVKVIQLPDPYPGCDSSVVKTILECKGLACIEIKEFNSAISIFSKLIKINPGDERYYSKRALSYENMQMKKEAVADYDKALKLNPNLLQERNNRGLLNRSLGKFALAMTDFDYVLSQDSSYLAARINKGLVFADEGKHEEAVKEYLKALSIDTSDILLFNLSISEAHIGAYKDALKHINLAIQINPDVPADCFINRAYIRMNLKDIQGACEDVRKVQSMNYIVEDPVLLKLCN